MKKHSHGYSLVELMVCITLMSFVIIIAASIFARTRQQYTQAYPVVSRLEPLIMGLNGFRRDVVKSLGVLNTTASFSLSERSLILKTSAGQAIVYAIHPSKTNAWSLSRYLYQGSREITHHVLFNDLRQAGFSYSARHVSLGMQSAQGQTISYTVALRP